MIEEGDADCAFIHEVSAKQGKREGTPKPYFIFFCPTFLKSGFRATPNLIAEYNHLKTI